MMPEDRLKQAEALLETAARYINRHEEAIARQTEINTRLDLRMLELVDMFSELTAIARQNQEQFNRHQEQFNRHQEEIRQLHEETHRIWQYLLSQSGNGRSQGDES